MSRITNTLAKYRIRPKKRLGQNFLHDEHALKTILALSNLSSQDHVLEIGAGIANLSVLIAPHVEKFYTLEKDKCFKKILHDRLSGFNNTQIILEDILRFKFETIFKGKKFKIIGNLPYYITSSILVHLVEQKEYIKNILITVQKEVAKRIVAAPGNKDYGRLSCFLQFYTKPEMIETFTRSQFFPKPEVDSALVKLSILDTPSVKVSSDKMFFKVIKAIFAQRRKTLLNNLASAGWGLKKEGLSEMLNKIKISPSIRGEQLTLTEIAKIADSLTTQIKS